MLAWMIGWMMSCGIERVGCVTSVLQLRRDARSAPPGSAGVRYFFFAGFFLAAFLAGSFAAGLATGFAFGAFGDRIGSGTHPALASSGAASFAASGVLALASGAAATAPQASVTAATR